MLLTFPSIMVSVLFISLRVKFISVRLNILFCLCIFLSDNIGSAKGKPIFFLSSLLEYEPFVIITSLNPVFIVYM